MPFRTPADPDAVPLPERTDAPPLGAFCADASTLRLVWTMHGVMQGQRIGRTSGVVEPAVVLGSMTSSLHFLPTEHALHAFSVRGHEVSFWRDALGEPEMENMAPEGFVPNAQSAALIASDQPAFMYVLPHENGREGLAVRVVDSAMQPLWRGQLSTGPTARRLLTAAGMGARTVALFSTDREDEIDLCALEPGGTRCTISLGRGQRFETAAGGGRKICVVSRGERDLVFRTVAQDLRTELNATPVVPRTGWTIESVSCAYANGPFVMLHTERHEARGLRDAVITLFGDGQVWTRRFASAPVDRVWVEGRSLLTAGLLGGASTPLLAVQQLTLLRDQKDWVVSDLSGLGGTQRRYVYPLAPASCGSPALRHAVLSDVAEVVALSLGAQKPRDAAVSVVDARADRMHFRVPMGKQGEIALSLLVRDDGSGVVAIKIGVGQAPSARDLSWTERLRQTLTGDDDGDPTTTRLETTQMLHAVEDILRAIWGLRTVIEG